MTHGRITSPGMIPQAIIEPVSTTKTFAITCDYYASNEGGLLTVDGVEAVFYVLGGDFGLVVWGVVEGLLTAPSDAGLATVVGDLAQAAGYAVSFLTESVVTIIATTLTGDNGAFTVEEV